MSPEQRDDHTVFLMQALSTAESTVRRISAGGIPHDMAKRLCCDAARYIETKRQQYLNKYPDKP